MPVYPDKLEIGQHVIFGGLDGGEYRGSVTSVTRDTVTVQYFIDGKDFTYDKRDLGSFLREACHNCGYSRSAHTEQGKCLYGPTTWK